MGCDGGTIPKRHELVKTAKRPEQKDKDMDRKAKWTTCSITQQSLAQPIVACELGRLYNKESVLEFLLNQSICETASHIRSLKDVKTLNLTSNAGYDKNASGTAQEYYDTQAAKYVCPVVGLEMNGKYKFVVLWSCGCVLSERAMKEVETDVCHNCGAIFESGDVVVLNAEDDDLKAMEEGMVARRERQKALRKGKKAEKRKAQHDELQKNANGFEVPNPIELTKKKVKGNKKELKDERLATNGTSSSSKKASQNSTLNGTTTSAAVAKSKKATQNGGSTSKKESPIDIKKSKVYQSLFTSGDDSKKRGKDQSAHWITYNPYHL